MKKILSVFVLIFSFQCAFSFEVYDADWCRKNGGIIEFDKKQNIKFDCLTRSINSIPYIQNIYNMACIPYYSSILNNREPMFLEIISETYKGDTKLTDEFNFKITENELVRYI